MGRYRAISPLAEPYIGAHAVDEFDHDFLSPDAERDAVNGGLVEIVPRKYRVLSDNYRVPQGEEFEDAFPMEIEAALIQGGHIEPVDQPLQLPAKSANKSEWEKAAHARGVPDDEIQNMTKDDLVARLSETDEEAE